MEYLPIFVPLHNQSCLIVGSGDAAQNKARLLQQAGARIKIISRTFSSSFQAQAKNYGFQLITGEFDESHLDGIVLVVVASKNITLSRHVSSAAKSRRILVNVIDNSGIKHFYSTRNYRPNTYYSRNWYGWPISGISKTVAWKN